MEEEWGEEKALSGNNCWLYPLSSPPGREEELSPRCSEESHWGRQGERKTKDALLGSINRRAAALDFF